MYSYDPKSKYSEDWLFLRSGKAFGMAKQIFQPMDRKNLKKMNPIFGAGRNCKRNYTDNPFVLPAVHACSIEPFAVAARVVPV